MTKTVYLSNDPDVAESFNWWDENDGEEWGIIYGLAGTDYIEGDAGNDYIDGGDGGDWIWGGKSPGYPNSPEVFEHQYWGHDILVGGPSGDILYAGSGNDQLLGGSGNDTLRAGDGDDYLDGGTGNDTLDGGGGWDTVGYLAAGSGVLVDLRYPWLNTGDAAGDTFWDIEAVIGSDYVDDLRGNQGPNIIDGAGGSDYLYGFEGIDVIKGLEGNDVLNGGPDADVLDGGNGSDWASYYLSAAGLSVDLLFTGSNTGEADGDSYHFIENLQGSQFADHLGGDQWVNLIQGDGGNDVIAGRGGVDLLFGEDGDDVLIGEDEGDVLHGGAGSNYASYVTSPVGLAADLLFTGSSTGQAAGDVYISIQNLQGSIYDDGLGGDDGPNIINALTGNDLLGGRGGADQLYGDDGNDILYGDGGADFLDGGNDIDYASYIAAPAGVHADLISGGLTGDAAGDSFNAIENLQGSQYGDGLFGNDLFNTILGLNGADVMDGRGSHDTLAGGGGNDAIIGGSGFDTAVFSGPRSAYTILPISGGYTVADNVGTDGTDTLVGIERLQFLGQTIDVAPVAHSDIYITPKNTPFNVTATFGVLANDSDAVGLPLSAATASGPQHGALTLNTSGGFTYTPIAGFVGNDSFTYRAGDGTTQSGTATVNLIVGNIDALATPAQFITELYVGYYNRAPDPGGLQYWISNYTTPPSQSPGGVNAFYQNIPHTSASFADPGQTETIALYPFLANPQSATYTDVVDFVTDAYVNLFGRTVDGADQGVRYWATSIGKSLGIAVPTFGDPVVDNTGPIEAPKALIALIFGALGNDAVTIANKVTVGLYYQTALIENNVAFTQASAHAALAGVTFQPASVLAAEASINVFIASAPPNAEMSAVSTLGALAPESFVSTLDAVLPENSVMSLDAVEPESSVVEALHAVVSEITLVGIANTDMHAIGS